MITEKIQIQKYSKIHKGTKNVRNPHIRRTLQILQFLDFLKFFGRSYGLRIVEIGSLHLEGGQMISGKIGFEKY